MRIFYLASINYWSWRWLHSKHLLQSVVSLENNIVTICGAAPPPLQWMEVSKVVELSLSGCNSYILKSGNTNCNEILCNWSGLPKLFKRLDCSIVLKTLIHTLFWSQNCNSAFDCQDSASELNSICTVFSNSLSF